MRGVRGAPLVGMDALGTNKQVKEKPPVPIKTYQWEDIRRARRKGGYPWTYLDKRPFDDNFIDDFKIRTDRNLRKAKSSVCINRNGLSVEEPFDFDTSNKSKMDEENKENLMVDSNDGSADVSISQYLDKEDRESSTDEMDALTKMHQDRVKDLSIGEEYEYWSKLQKGEIPNVLGSEWPMPNLSLKSVSRASSKEVLDVPGPSKSKDQEKTETLRSERAKSEEPRRKRKHSIDSSYSRVSKYSLSPQGIIKKIKEAKDKIKLPKLFTKSETKLNKKAKTEEPLVEIKPVKKETKDVKGKKEEGPKYIHIPLKPPPGETDEFSYLEFETKDSSRRDVSPIAEETKEEVPETPIESGTGVQLIILTAPSDDEILDTPAVPETPSEQGNGFFEEKRMDELKKLATDTVDKYSPETKRKVFSPVKEEDVSDELREKKQKIEEKVEESTKEEKTGGSEDVKMASSVPEKEDAMVIDKPPVVPADEAGAKKKKKKVIKKEKSKDKTTPKEEKLMETQKTDDDKLQEQKEKQKIIKETKLTIDEEDGLKTETVIAELIDEDVKKQDLIEKEKKKEIDVKKSPVLLRKKVSFKRRSKEDSDGIYEDVLVTSEPVQKEKKVSTSVPSTPSTPSSPKVLADDKIARMHEEKTKGMTIAEEYEYWKKVQKGELPCDPDSEPIPVPHSPTSPTPKTPTPKSSTPTTPTPRSLTPSSPRSPTPSSPNYLTDERITKMHEERVKGMTPAEEYAYWRKVQRGEIPDELPPEEPKEVVVVPEVPVASTSSSPVPDMHLDERLTQIHQENVQGMSLAEEYAYWSHVNCHDYEPVIPPDGNFRPIDSPSADGHLLKKPSTPITDNDIEVLAAKAADIELRTTGIMTVPKKDKDDGAEALFVPLESALKDETKSMKSEGKEEGHGKRIQDAIQKQATNLKRQASIVSKKATEQAEKIQTRVKSIKKPKIKMPPKPKFEKPNLSKLKIDRPHIPHFKIEKPKMPKLPEKMKNISLSLPRKGKRSPRQPTSTESTVGDSEKRTVFDFSTYPRIFRRKKREDDGDDIHTPRTGTDVTPESERSTLPRFKFTTRWKGKFTKQQPSSATNDTVNSCRSKDSERSETQGSVRIPLHSEESIDRESLDLRTKEDREDSVERRMRLAASSRYDDDIDMNDAYMKENQEIHRASSFNAKFNDRWNHGTFHTENAPEQMVTDLDEEKQPISILKKKIENIHAGSSDDVHHRGVLEEINPDEFFLRQKGISQDNIEVGAYLSSEIREAFRTPNNALSQLETAQPEAPKRRPFKKPKRKKTPHVSQEGIQYDQQSIHTEPDVSTYQNDEIQVAQPERPKRKGKKKEDNFDIKYIEDQILSQEEFMERQPFSYYENDHMEGIEQPNILLSDSYNADHFYPDDDIPAAPPRKHKSLRSLNAMSEHDSITEELHGYKDVQQDVNQFEHEYQIPTPDQPPKRPFRTRSRTRSHSRGITLPDEETLAQEMLTTTSQQSLTCNEEPCRKVTCDFMGYSVIDKPQSRDPPLPPCRRRSLKSEEAEEERFFTVPRSTTHTEPIRPLRNYSTLGPSRPPRKRSVPNLTDEEKHIGDPYIEIEEDDHSKNLKSGAIIQKMKSRPLPAPPRPPRKTRDRSLGSRSVERSYDDLGSRELHDVETSVQTEPLPDDFECEALVRDPHDRIITPTVDKYAEITKPKAIREFEHQETITHGSLVVQPFGHGEEIPTGPIEMYSRNTERIVSVKREAITDKEADYDETSEIPEEFTKLKSPTPQPPAQQVIERIIEKHIPIQLEPANEVETLKAQKLQVADLDVDRLAVNELHASKIKVGDIESSALNVNEINSNSGNLVVSGIELPASFFQQLVEKLQEQAEAVVAARPAPPPIEAPHVKTIETRESETNTDAYQVPIEQLQTVPPSEVRKLIPEVGTSSQDIATSLPDSDNQLTEHIEPEQLSSTEYTLREHIGQEIDEVIFDAQQTVDEEMSRNAFASQKKTPFEVRLVDVVTESVTPPDRPPKAVKVELDARDTRSLPPPPPPRAEESEETPPPRPPKPDSDYLPSQPPPSFYALRSPPAVFKDFDIDDDIPLAPRRRRLHHHQHHKAPPESSSEEVVHARRRHRTPEPTIPQLTGQLTRACYNAAERSLKRLIQQTTEYVMGHVDGKHEVNVAVVILIVFIALLFLVYWNGDGKQVHHHHWEYFNPPRDI